MFPWEMAWRHLGEDYLKMNFEYFGPHMDFAYYFMGHFKNLACYLEEQFGNQMYCLEVWIGNVAHIGLMDFQNFYWYSQQ